MYVFLSENSWQCEVCFIASIIFSRISPSVFESFVISMLRYVNLSTVCMLSSPNDRFCFFPAILPQAIPLFCVNLVFPVFRLPLSFSHRSSIYSCSISCWLYFLSSSSIILCFIVRFLSYLSLFYYSASIGCFDKQVIWFTVCLFSCSYICHTRGSSPVYQHVTDLIGCASIRWYPSTLVAIFMGLHGYLW